LYTADRCCGEVYLADCWVEGFSFETCCDEEARAKARQVHDRLQVLKSKTAEQPTTQCFQDGRHFNLRHFMSQNINLAEFAKTESHAVLSRMQWRHGQQASQGRCAEEDDSGLEPAVHLHDQLLSGGAAMTGLMVNLGAGAWDDPLYALARQRNLSGVFIDPMGPAEGLSLPAGVHFLSEAAAPKNLETLFRRGGLQGSGTPVHVDFLKIDVDSCDCPLAAAALRLVRPKVILMEVNMGIPPPIRFARQCHQDWRSSFVYWNRGGRTLATHGCSLSAAVSELAPFGYGLLRLTGPLDAIFVHRDYDSLFGGVGIDEIACHNEALGTGRAVNFWPWWHINDWRHGDVQEALANIWCNLTMHDWVLGISHIPFSLSV